jgi:hypothetical protein
MREFLEPPLWLIAGFVAGHLVTLLALLTPIGG